MFDQNLRQRFGLAPVQPLPGSFAFFPSLGIGAVAGAGTMLICIASEFPPEGVLPMGFGVGFMFTATAAIAALNGVWQERVAYWQYKKSAAEALVEDHPAVQQPAENRKESGTAVWIPKLNGFTAGLASFQSIDDDLLKKVTWRIGNGNYSLAFNQMRAIGMSDPQINRFRQELVDRRLASEMIKGNKTEIVLNSSGKQYFFRLFGVFYKKPLPSSTQPARAMA